MFIIFGGWIAVLVILGYLFFLAFKAAFYIVKWSFFLVFGALAFLGIGTGEIIKWQRQKKLTQMKAEQVFITTAMMALYEVRSGSETTWQTRSTELAASCPQYASWLPEHTESLDAKVANAMGDDKFEASVADLKSFTDYDYAYWVCVRTGAELVADPIIAPSGPRDWSPAR